MFVKFGLPLILIVVLLAGWEYSKPSYPVNTEANADTDRGPPPPRNANEDMFKESRHIARKTALEGLQQPWAAMCAGEGRRSLISSVNYYYEQRGLQERSYPARWGDTGRSYIVGEWSTTDDHRIEQLTQDMVSRGYLKPATLNKFVAERVNALANGAPVTAQPCKG